MEDTFKTRLVKEAEDLHEKIKKLDDFIGSKKYEEVSPIQRSLLAAQLPAMAAYHNILLKRIDNLENP